MRQQEKAAIANFIALYNLPDEQRTAAEGFILPAAMFIKSYLRRHDLPAPLYPVCAQLAIAQQVSSGLLKEISSQGSQSGEESTTQAGVKSISQGDTSITFETAGETKKNAASIATSSKIAISPQQVIEENKEILSRYRRGLVRP